MSESWVGWRLRAARVEPTVSANLMETQTWHLGASALKEGRAHQPQHGFHQLLRASESCPSSPHPEVRQFCSSPYVSVISSAAAPALELTASDSVGEGVLAGPLGGMPGAPATLLPSQPQRLLVFTARSYGISLPDTGALGWRGAEPPCSSGWGRLQSSYFPLVARRCGTILFCAFAPPTSLEVASAACPLL